MPENQTADESEIREPVKVKNKNWSKPFFTLEIYLHQNVFFYFDGLPKSREENIEFKNILYLVIVYHKFFRRWGIIIQS